MFKTKTPLLIATLHALGLTSGLALAEVAAETEVKAEAKEKAVIVKAEPSVDKFELGIGYISDDSYKFGRFNGMTEEGLYVIGDIKAKNYADEGSFWKLRATNLGLDSRYLRLDAGVQGSQQFFLEYDQLPDYVDNTGTTPFTDPGSTNLTLPADYDAANLNSFLQPFEQKTERERVGVGGKFLIKSRWELGFDLSHETREGTDWIGSSMGPTDEFNLLFKTTGALLPEPIDYETDKINLALLYHGKETQLEFAYDGSLFYNNDASLTWQDPFDLTRTGRMALEPDNQMHQLSTMLGQTLSTTTRLTALASVSLLTQDEKFLPLSTTTTIASLPRTSLDGEVWLYRGQLKLTSKPTRKLRLGAQYSYDERDNKTATADYDYFVADGISGQFAPRTNDPLSYRSNKVDLTANYRINSKMSLRGGYQYKHMHRDSEDQERQTTEEHTLSAKWKIRATSKLDLALYGESSKRTGSAYETRPFENPSLRNFNLADLERTKLGLSANYKPTQRLSLGLTTEYLDDDYSDSVLGLTQSQQPSLLLNAAYQINDRITTHAFYSHEQDRSQIAGAQDGKLTTPDWHADLNDTIDSVGIGAQSTGLANKWDIGADLVHTRSRGEIDMSTTISTITIPDSLAGIPTTEQYSDLKTELSSLQLWAQYQHSDTIVYKFSYWYERFSEEDWAVDGTVNNYTPLENDTIDQFLFLGNDRLDYNVHVIGLAVNVRF